MAQTRQYQLECELDFADGPGGKDAHFQCKSFTLTDRLNEGYRLVVRCEIPSEEFTTPDESTSKYALQDVRFTIRRWFPDGQRVETRLFGLVESVHRLSAPARGRADIFEVEVVSAFTLLREHQRGQTWHRRTYVEVLEETLRRDLELYGRTFEARLSKTYPVIDFTVRRPNESTFEFVRELCRRTGICILFTHDGPRESLVLVDANEAFVDGQVRYPGEPIPLAWEDNDQEERVISVSRRPPFAKDRALKSFDIEGPTQPVTELFSLDFAALGALLGLGGGGGGGAQPSKEISDPFRVNELQEPEEQHRQRGEVLQDIDANRYNAFGVETNIGGALAGRRFRMQVAKGDERDFIVTTVKGHGTNMSPEFGGDYGNELELVPVVTNSGSPVNIRPPEPQPDRRLNGIYRAEVVAVENEPVDVDSFLRCRLRFWWEEETQETPMTYVSVLQPQAGTHGGTQWIPRAGDRCLVCFIAGDAERPVILGFLYDNELKPPMMGLPEGEEQLPKSFEWLGWNFASIGDKARVTKLCMAVQAGAEMFYVGAPRDRRLDVGNDSDVRITRNETRNVGEALSESIGTNYHQQVGEQRRETVGKDYALEVAQHYSIVAQKMSVEAEGGASFTLGGGLSSTVRGGISENVSTGSRTTRVFDGSYNVTAAQSLNMRAPSVNISSGGFGGGMGAASGGVVSLGAASRLESPAGATVRSGASSISAEPEGASVRAPKTVLEDQLGGRVELSAGALVVDAPRGITFRCGVHEISLSPTGVSINGQQITMSALDTEVRTGRFRVVRSPIPSDEEG